MNQETGNALARLGLGLWLLGCSIPLLAIFGFIFLMAWV